MNKELLDFMTWVNQDKKLGYTSIGVERIVNKYITSKERYYQIIDDCYKNWISSGKCYKFRRNLYVQPSFEILSVNEGNAEDFSYINSAGYYGFEKDGIEELWVDFSKLINSKHLEKFILDGFIYKIKTDSEFSEKWGPQIEERELSLEERVDLMRKRTRDGAVDYDNRHHYFLDTHNIPTKQITLEYNNEKTYYYE